MSEFSKEQYESYLKEFDLSTNCSISDITKAYKKIIKISHPDKFFSDQELYVLSQNITKKYNIIYEYLCKYYEQYINISTKQFKNKIKDKDINQTGVESNILKNNKNYIFSAIKVSCIIPACALVLLSNPLVINNKFLMKKIEPAHIDTNYNLDIQRRLR